MYKLERQIKYFINRFITYSLAAIFLPFLLIYTRFINKRPLFVIAMPYGKLGNRLILFSHFIAFALKNNYEVFNPAFGEYGVFFQTTNKDLFCRFPPRSFFVKGHERIRKLFCYIFNNISVLVRGKLKNVFIDTIELPFFEFDEKYLLNGESIFSGKELALDSQNFLHLIKNKDIIFIRGWRFRDNKHFQEFGDEIRKYFTPLESIQKNIDFLLKKARTNCEVLVGVHIRQTDYKKWLKGRYFYSIDEFITIMKKMEDLFFGKQIGFLLCSDSMLDNNKFINFNVKFTNHHFVEDLYALAKCDYILGPPSTYSGWASFYGKVPLHWIEKANEDITFDSFKVFHLLRGVEFKLKSGATFII